MPEGPADTVLRNGRILTGEGLTPTPSTLPPRIVTHLAIRHGRILAIGDADAVLPWSGPDTAHIDLHGSFAMPGFNDAHLHLGLAGQQALALNLTPATSLRDLLDRLATYFRQQPTLPWILGGGWDQTRWPEHRLPTRDDLDPITGSRPTLLRRVDAHIAVANSAALSLAGITSYTGNPPGAEIDRDPSGRPTGILREAAALALVDRVIPPLTSAQRRQGLHHAMSVAAAHGVTSVHDNSDWDDFPMLQAMLRDNDLPVRVAEWMDFNRPLDELDDRRRSHPALNPWLHLTHLKGFLDGSLGSRTAALLAPYADDPSNLGLPRYADDHLLALTHERLAQGFPIAFHAIGDRANRQALNTFQSAFAAKPSARDLRCRIEHAQLVSPPDILRFAQLGVLASMQPCHLLSDGAWLADRLRPTPTQPTTRDRTADAFSWGTLLRSGAHVPFGTDFPVESVSPFRGLYSAITRQPEPPISTRSAVHPEQCLTLTQALFASTQAPAYAEFREHTKGRLTPGFLADVVILDRDPFTVEPAELLTIRVLRTIVHGRTVFSDEIAPPA